MDESAVFAFVVSSKIGPAFLTILTLSQSNVPTPAVTANPSAASKVAFTVVFSENVPVVPDILPPTNPAAVATPAAPTEYATPT